MGKRILTPSAAAEILRLRAMQDEWGDALHTGFDIAGILGVSEATVWRVIKRQAAYARVKDLPTVAESKASQGKLLEMLAGDTSGLAPELQESLEKLKGLITPKTAVKLPEELAEKMKAFGVDPGYKD